MYFWSGKCNDFHFCKVNWGGHHKQDQILGFESPLLHVVWDTSRKHDNNWYHLQKYHQHHTKVQIMSHHVWLFCSFPMAIVTEDLIILWMIWSSPDYRCFQKKLQMTPKYWDHLIADGWILSPILWHHKIAHITYFTKITDITKLWMTSHQVWLSSSISIGHSPPLWYSLPIRLWLVGTSWKTRYFCSDFLLREEGRFTFIRRRRTN